MRLLLVAIALCRCAWAQDLDVVHVQGSVYMIAGAGGNVAVQIGPSGVLMVDSGSAASTAKLLDAVRKLSGGKPLRYLINTHVHVDQTGGNEAVAKAGGSTGVRGIRGTPGESLTNMVQILAHDNVMQRMVTEATLPDLAQPTDTWIGPQKDLFFNGETIAILHQPAAHTDGDSMVHFRRSDVIVAGDIIDMNRYPVIDLARGGNVQGVIEGLNRLLKLAIPEHHEEGGTYIIPGRGRVVDEFDVVEYRDMVTIIRDRIRAMAKKNMTLGQIKEARPTRDYDGRFGSPDAFVEAVYKSLAK